MFTIIQIVISIVVIYLVFSVMVYVIVEWIAGLLRLRGKTLQSSILKIFEGTAYADLGNKIFQHPQVDCLKSKGKLPSYIPAANIAMAMIDLVKDNDVSPGGNKVPSDSDVYQRCKKGLAQLDSATSATKGQLQGKSFLTSLTEQTHDLKSLTEAIEKWY